MDLVLSVCDNAANEVCPRWPGQPIIAHWGVPDPAAIKGTPEDIERAFHNAFETLARRIALLLLLSPEGLEKLKFQDEINRIGWS